MPIPVGMLEPADLLRQRAALLAVLERGAGLPAGRTLALALLAIIARRLGDHDEGHANASAVTSRAGHGPAPGPLAPPQRLDTVPVRCSAPGPRMQPTIGNPGPAIGCNSAPASRPRQSTENGTERTQA